MSEKESRILLALEALLLCLPLTSVFVVYGFPAFIDFSLRPPHYADWIANAFILLTLAAAWILLLTFVVRGRTALRKLSVYWWLLPVLAACLVVISLIRLAVAVAVEPHWFNLFGWGLPLLFPLTHVCIERWRRVNTQSPPRRAIKQ